MFYTYPNSYTADRGLTLFGQIYLYPEKKENGVNGQFFFTFLKLVMGVLETTFWIQITFGLVGRGLKWSKLT